ncbi:hypothetical protein HK16_03235 [Acetobacter senegalensis]|uniref:Uncharacterized protein n=2 Tax=Acetobacter TaxID=434 RepID=A0A252EDW8_9PROT|nr:MULTISPECIES: hypothetical protein [Acetobacter]ATJ92819.1 hypothetical protein CIW82_18390 [Acetobacter tropicalis]OUL64635.1 hypothetical protein HK16_03235 [Acetobacter senegalensis]
MKIYDVEKYVVKGAIAFLCLFTAYDISNAERLINHSIIPSKVKFIHEYNGRNRKEFINKIFDINLKKEKDIFSKNTDEYYFLGKIDDVERGSLIFSHKIVNGSLKYNLFLSFQSSDCFDFHLFENELGNKNYRLLPLVSSVVARKAIWGDNNRFISVSYIQRLIGADVKKCVYLLDMEGKEK